MEKKGYAGKIGNTGCQYVEAPYRPEKKRTGSVKRGEDQRCGKKKSR